MTKNNWIEEFEKEFIYHKGHYLDGLLKSGLSDIEVRSFISDLLTKKDQEHKAELEMINRKVKKIKTHNVEAPFDDYIATVNKEEVIAILDSHINKLSN